MTDPHPLYDRVHDELDHLSCDVSTDLVALDRVARCRGTRIRRRRQGVIALGSATAVAVGALGFAGLTDFTTETPPYASTASDPSAEPRPQDTEPSSAPAPTRRNRATMTPLDGRTTAALLGTIVAGVQDGATSDYAGQGDSGGASRDTYAELRLTPTGDQGFGIVGVNVQGPDVINELQPFGCETYMLDCEQGTSPGGERLRTYREQPDGSGDVRLVVERWSADESMRVVVAATNGLDLGGNRWQIARPTAVLNSAQLSEIATDARWDFDVPARYVASGRDLTPYTDLDSD